MKTISILLIIGSLLVFSNTKGQLALAVAKNENGSSIKYSLKLGKDLDDAANLAKKELEDLLYKDIYVLKSTEKTGHELSKGYYVLIITSRKDYARKLFISYGLGAADSKQEAIERALMHLSEFDLGYNTKIPYTIEKEGKIEEFYPKEEKKK